MTESGEGGAPADDCGPFSTLKRVGWGDLDANGHMRNTAWLDAGATARMQAFAALGFTPADFAKAGVGPVIRRDRIDYETEAHLLEELTVTVELAGLSGDGRRFIVRNRFFKADGRPAATLTSRGGWLDLRLRRFVTPPTALAAAMERWPHSDDFEALPDTPSVDAPSEALSAAASEELTLRIDHMSLSVEDLARGIAFYTPLLATLGLELVAELGPEVTGTVGCAGFGLGRKSQLWLAEKGRQSPRAHLCFRARSRAEVRAFHAAGLAAGGTNNGAPGLRELYHPAYYAAFLLDPEGHNIEAVCFEPEADEA